MGRRLFTSESVTEGHPDKIADQVSDALLDALLFADPDCRVACETLVTTGLVLVAGEITTSTHVEVPEVVRSTLRRIGYTNSAYGIDADTCAVITTIDRQSAHIAMGVDRGGAGDQGMMFGYATDETEELMPAPIQFAHRITKRLAEVRHSGELAFLRPDGKSQVTIEYEDDRPVRVHTVVVSAQHDPDVRQADIHEAVREHVVRPVIPAELLDMDDCTFHINPTGMFEIGGPHGDAGVTGRKIIVDTYGGMGRHGGGAFSGKDPHESRPFRRLCGAMGRQAGRSVRGRPPVRDPARVCDRRSRARFHPRGYVRNRAGCGKRDRGGAAPYLRFPSTRDHRGPRPAQPRVHADRRLRAFRPGAAVRGRAAREDVAVRLGAHRPRRSAT